MTSSSDSKPLEQLFFAQASLIEKIYVLIQLISRPLQKFPKPWRYSLGEKLPTSLLSSLEYTCQALAARQPLKEPYILQAIGSLQTAELFIRLAFEESLISDQQYFDWSHRVQESLKMSMGWLTSVRPSNPKSDLT